MAVRRCLPGLLLAASAVAQEPVQVPVPVSIPIPTRAMALELISGQPAETLDMLRRDGMVLIDPIDVAGSKEDRFIEALVIFQTTRKQAITLLSQTHRQGEYRPELDTVKTIEVTEDGSIQLHEMRILFTHISYYVRDHVDLARGRIMWELDPRFGGPLADLEGYWQLLPLQDGQTLGRFGTRVDAGPAVPSFLQGYVTRKTVPQTVDRARKWVDSDGKYRP